MEIEPAGRSLKSQMRHADKLGANYVIIIGEDEVTSGRLTVRGSYMAITEPAPELLGEIGWTGGESLRDFRSSVHYIRTTPDGRIAMGLGGIQPDLARRIELVPR